MAQSDETRSLDVDFNQVLIYFDEDDRFHWHHRVLVQELTEPGKWVVITPDLEVESCNLSDFSVIPVRRAAAFPARAAGDSYVFGTASQVDWDLAVAEARSLAAILGAKPAAVTAAGVRSAEWRVADPGIDSFDTVIDEALTQEGPNFVVRGNNALCNLVGPDGQRSWILAQKVFPTDYDTWVDLKRAGPGRDIRIASALRAPSGRRGASLAQSLALSRPTPQTDWPFRGPQASGEFLEGVLASGQELSTFDGFWMQRCGLNKGANTAHTHRNILTALALFQGFDQVDMQNLAGVEFLSRWVLMLHAAVRKNPKQPSYVGLDAYLSHAFDESGGIITTKFSRHIADEQKAEAQIWKQQRLWIEEQETDAKAKAKAKNLKGGGKGAAAEEA